MAEKPNNILIRLQEKSKMRHTKPQKIVDGKPIKKLLQEREQTIEEKEVLRKKLAVAREKLDKLNNELETIGIENFTEYRPDVPFVPIGVKFKEDELKKLADHLNTHVVFYDAQDSCSQFLPKSKIIPLATPKVNGRTKKERFVLKKAGSAPANPASRIDFKKVAQFVKEEEIKKTEYVRPPAEYSNRSPYGIATEGLMQQLAEEHAARRKARETED